jgi:hypothetical protein
MRLEEVEVTFGSGHVLDGIGICVRCGACSCCVSSEERLVAPCEGYPYGV